jgi:hypothetical protein
LDADLAKLVVFEESKPTHVAHCAVACKNIIHAETGETPHLFSMFEVDAFDFDFGVNLRFGMDYKQEYPLS